MKKMKPSVLLKLFAATALVLCAFTACSDDGPGSPEGDGDMTDYYEIADAAFRDYLIYNSGLSSGSAALPAGLVIEQGGKYYLSKSLASKVTALELSQPSAGNTASANIASLDGIQYFTDLQSLDITGNSVAGSLDLSKLTALETLKMDGNLVNELLLPPSLATLNYAAASQASESQKLTAVNLGQFTKLAELSLPGHAITKEGLVLPTIYTSLKYIDLSGNDGAPFEIPEALYDQLETKIGVDVIKDMTKYAALADAAFGDYLIYNTTLPEEDENNLPADLVMVDGDVYYVNKEVAGTVKRLYVAKDADAVAALTAADMDTSGEPITDLSGIELFTALETFIGSGNNFGATLNTGAMAALVTLEAAGAGVSEVDLTKNTALQTLIVAGSNDAGYDYGKLTGIDLRMNANLQMVELSNNSIDPDKFVLPLNYSKLEVLHMGGNIFEGDEVIYKIPEDLYDSLTDSSGVESVDDDGDYTGPTPKSQYLELVDEFYAKYLTFLSQGSTLPSYFAEQALPEGTAVLHTDGKYYLNKLKAAEVTVLNINLFTDTANALKAAGLSEAESGVTSGLIPALEGIEFFINLNTLNTANCRMLGTLDLSKHTSLTYINMDGARIHELQVPASSVHIQYQGWRDSKDVRLRAIDLSACTNIEYLRFDRHLFSQETFILPAVCPNLTYLRLGDRTVNGNTIIEDGVNLTNVTITIPAAIYDNLTSTAANNKVGVTRGE